MRCLAGMVGLVWGEGGIGYWEVWLWRRQRCGAKTGVYGAERVPWGALLTFGGNWHHQDQELSCIEVFKELALLDTMVHASST